jgi:VIT1/CCC1 family predicted Fe2+/Mn2+ transporter
MTAQESRDPSKGIPTGTLAGLSAFVARVLDQLSISAWLPSAFLTVAGAFLLQFRAQRSLNFAIAATNLTKHPPTVLILAVPVLVSTTLITQAFSFEAIRILEGYWHRPGAASLVRNLMIRWHAYRKTSLQARRIRAREKAFAHARPRLLKGNVPHELVNALEAKALGTQLPSLTLEQEARLQKMNWRSKCNAWELALVDHLLAVEGYYPEDSRILPTRLGNLMRATEDKLRHAGQDLEGYALRRGDLVSHRVQQQHDQFRARLDMYCILVFVSGLLAVLTPALLLGRAINIWAILILLAGFAAVSFSSYQAAIASAKGYCVTLKEMDNAATN